MKKILSFALAAIMLVSMVPTAFAAENNWQGGTEVTYTATGTESWTVTVPAQLAPGGEGNVVAQGTWASNRKLVVTADATVTLENSIKSTDQKVLDVTFPGIGLVGSNTAAVADTKEVSVAAMPADALFGTWSGKFNYNVEWVDVAAEMITFTLKASGTLWDGSATFQAEEVMTWHAWLNSEYCKTAQMPDGGDTYDAAGFGAGSPSQISITDQIWWGAAPCYYIVGPDGDYVIGSDIIEANFEYTSNENTTT